MTCGARAVPPPLSPSLASVGERRASTATPQGNPLCPCVCTHPHTCALPLPLFFPPFAAPNAVAITPPPSLSLFFLSLLFFLSGCALLSFFLFDTARSAASWSVLADNQMACCRADRQWAAWIMTGAISDTDQIRQCCLAHCK